MNYNTSVIIGSYQMQSYIAQQQLVMHSNKIKQIIDDNRSNVTQRKVLPVTNVTGSNVDIYA